MVAAAAAWGCPASWILQAARLLQRVRARLAIEAAQNLRLARTPGAWTARAAVMHQPLKPFLRRFH